MLVSVNKYAVIKAIIGVKYKTHCFLLYSIKQNMISATIRDDTNHDPFPNNILMKLSITGMLFIYALGKAKMSVKRKYGSINPRRIELSLCCIKNSLLL